MTLGKSRKFVTAIAVALIVAAFVKAADEPEGSLIRLSTGEEVKFEYREFGCFGGGRECVGSIVRSKRGWRFTARKADSAQKFGRCISVSLTKEEIASWDAALRPKKYRDDEVVLSGGFSISITWPDGGRQTLNGTGDDDRLSRLLLKHFEKCPARR